MLRTLAVSVTCCPATIWRASKASSEADFGRPLYRPSDRALCDAFHLSLEHHFPLELREAGEDGQNELAGCALCVDRLAPNV
jgi:hypothetical protein